MPKSLEYRLMASGGLLWIVGLIWLTIIQPVNGLGWTVSTIQFVLMIRIRYTVGPKLLEGAFSDAQADEQAAVAAA